MATFSQGFLANLGRPQMAQGLFGLGQAIGGVPGQLRQRRQQEQFNQLMQQAQGAQAAGDITSMKLLSQQLSAAGYTQEAGQLMQAAMAAEDKQKMIKAGSGMFSEDPAQARASAQQLAAMGRFSEASQALTRAGQIEEKQKGVVRQRTSAQALISEIQGILKTPDISDENKEKALDLLRETAVAGENADILKPQVDELKKSMLPEKIGTRGSPTIRSMYSEEDRQYYDYAIYRDDSGNVVSQKLKPSKVEPKKEEDPFDKKWASDLLTEARDKSRDARMNAEKYSQLASEAANRTFYERAFIGKALSATEEAMGLAGSATTHRRRINEVRMSGALNLLPKGPASDRDVELAMDASIDPNNLTNEEAESYLRGMEKIARLEEEYYSLKLQYMQDANDPNAIGFEDLVAKKAAERGFNELKSNAPASTQAFQEKIKQANALTNQAEREAALKELEMLFPNAFELLSNLNAATERWNNTVKRNPNLQGIF